MKTEIKAPSRVEAIRLLVKFVTSRVSREWGLQEDSQVVQILERNLNKFYDSLPTEVVTALWWSVFTKEGRRLQRTILSAVSVFRSGGIE